MSLFGSKATFVCGRGRELRLVADDVERDRRLRRVHYVLALPSNDPLLDYDVFSVASFTPPGFDPAHDGTDIVPVFSVEDAQAIHDQLRENPGVRPDLSQGRVVKTVQAADI